MGASLSGTGWFGRGAAGAAGKYEARNKKYAARPARQQVRAHFSKSLLNIYRAISACPVLRTILSLG